PNHLTIVTTNATNWTDDVRPNMRPADQNRFSDEIRLEGIDREQSRMLLEKRLQDFGLGKEIVAQFDESEWLQTQFKPQPRIGVRHLLMGAADRFRKLGLQQTSSKLPSIDEAFATEVNKVRAKPALHQYNQDCLMWFTQFLAQGFDGVEVDRPRNKY